MSEIWDASSDPGLLEADSGSSGPGHRGRGSTNGGRYELWDPTTVANWPRLLVQVGGADPDLVGQPKADPCPACGGRDRFQWFDRDDDGWHCRGCGGRDRSGGGGSWKLSL